MQWEHGHGHKDPISQSDFFTFLIPYHAYRAGSFFLPTVSNFFDQSLLTLIFIVRFSMISMKTGADFSIMRKTHLLIDFSKMCLDSVTICYFLSCFAIMEMARKMLGGGST